VACWWFIAWSKAHIVCCRLGHSGVRSQVRIAQPVSTRWRHDGQQRMEGSGRTLAVNPRDGMADPGTVPAVGIELKRVYL
jgi:hypothetical protein